MDVTEVIEHNKTGRQLVIKVQVVPRASRSEIIGEHNGALRVRVAAPPVEGAANDELVRLIAKTIKVPRSCVEVTSGQSSRFKRLRIVDAPANALELLTVGS